MDPTRKKFTELKERSGDIPDAELDEFWTDLRPATIDGTIGEWKGGEFRTGHKMNGQLERAGWFQPVGGGVPRRGHRHDGLLMFPGLTRATTISKRSTTTR